MDNNLKEIDDSFQAFLVEGARFTKNEEYPILESKMISKNIPQKIMPFNKAINYKGDLSDVFICTFAPDKSFERVRRNPKKYLNFFKRCAGIIGFDFSVHSDMPIIKQKSQMNDNLSLTYYYANNGVPVIPNIRIGVDELIPEFFETIPKQSIVAIGTHGFIKKKYEKYEWYYFINKLIKELNPTCIVVYGRLSSNMFDDFKSKVKIIEYNSWISERWKEALTYGN